MAYESDPTTLKINELVGSLEAYFWLLCFDELSPAQQALVAIWELQQKVYNGGFRQYFANSSGDHAPAIRGILRNVGANSVANILDRAISQAGPNVPWDDREARYMVFDALSEDSKDKLFDLSDEFFAQSDELNRLLFQYLSERRDEIEAPAEFWTEVTAE